MSTIILARGADGEIVRRIQVALQAFGAEPGILDGDFGPKTQSAVEAFQRATQIPVTGEVDIPTWRKLLNTEPPPPRDLCLQLTAAFEGHGFTLAQGNFDGAGVTWGVIGFTLKHGDIRTIVRAVRESHPGIVEEAFGSKTSELLSVLDAKVSERVAWADSISIGTSKTSLRQPWRDAFQRFGEFREVQDEQIRLADERYFQPALRTAAEHLMATQLGLALCFDIHVQNGGIKAAARNRIDELLASQPVTSERERRMVIANAVADTALPRWRDDVRSRKTAIASGTGQVHGRLYVLRNWGLSECPAVQAAGAA